jgi:hypothetical protein
LIRKIKIPKLKIIVIVMPAADTALAKTYKRIAVIKKVSKRRMEISLLLDV